MREHILVVEDEKHLGVGIKYNLEAENYRVTLVNDGPTALRLVDAGNDNFHLIILDLMLPGMSGYTVCETIRDAGVNTPVLMLSARTLAEDRARGFDAGANQYKTVDTTNQYQPAPGESGGYGLLLLHSLAY